MPLAHMAELVLHTMAGMYCGLAHGLLRLHRVVAQGPASLVLSLLLVVMALLVGALLVACLVDVLFLLAALHVPGDDLVDAALCPSQCRPQDECGCIHLRVLSLWGRCMKICSCSDLLTSYCWMRSAEHCIAVLLKEIRSLADPRQVATTCLQFLSSSYALLIVVVVAPNPTAATSISGVAIRVGWGVASF